MGHTTTCRSAWLELVADVLQARPGTQAFPHERVAGLLMESFDSACCSLNVVDSSWVDHVVAGWPAEYLATTPPPDVPPDATTQPLIRWHAVTGSSAAKVLSRVPPEVAPPRMAAAWSEFARPLGIAHQLSMPLRVDHGIEGYVVCRPDDDYTDADVELADSVLRALAAVFRQHRVVDGAPAGVADDLGLTERELAVLVLLGEGLTALAIARRLQTSPRTVQKHLEHVYRKLGVRDRLMAVQRAREAGLLGRPVVRAVSPAIPTPRRPAEAGAAEVRRRPATR